MKKIINGRKYNTETATLVCSFERGYPGDFNHCYEELYLKRTGEFFLYGEGGAASKYSMSCGQNCWTGGCDIVPISKQKALAFAEKSMDVDDYENFFGEVEE